MNLHSLKTAGLLSLLLLISPIADAGKIKLKLLPEEFIVLVGSLHNIERTIGHVFLEDNLVVIEFDDRENSLELSKAFINFLESLIKKKKFLHGFSAEDTLLGIALLYYSGLPYTIPEKSTDLIVKGKPREELKLKFKKAGKEEEFTVIRLKCFPNDCCRLLVKIVDTKTKGGTEYAISRPCTNSLSKANIEQALSLQCYRRTSMTMDDNCYFEALLAHSKKKMTQKELREKLFAIFRCLHQAIAGNPALEAELATILNPEGFPDVGTLLASIIADEDFTEGGHPLYWGDLAFTPFMVLILGQPINVAAFNPNDNTVLTHSFGNFSFSAAPTIQAILQQQLHLNAPPGIDNAIHIFHNGGNHFDALELVAPANQPLEQPPQISQ